jgi:hypothetical protein
MDQPADIATDRFVRRSSDYHASTVPRILGWIRPICLRTLAGQPIPQEASSDVST